MRLARVGSVPCADQESRDLFYGFLSSRQPNSCETTAHERFEALDGKRKMRTSFVTDKRVNLVYYQSSCGGEHSSSAFAREEYVQGLRRCNDDVRRLLRHRSPLACR